MLLIENKTIGGILLVSGTTIGAGILALPPVTGLAGFYPSLLLFFLYWMYFTFTALLMLEATLWMEDHTNLITMARKTLGRGGVLLSWTAYLFLLYSLTTAYLAGGSRIFTSLYEGLSGYVLPDWAGALPLLAIFGFFVYRGALFVDVANRVLMLGLTATYCIAVVFLAPHVKQQLLQYTNWKFVIISNSIIATSFGFHIIIPSLATYMDRNVKQLKIAIVVGSLLPFVVYVLWEWISLGVIPLEGKHGIVEGYAQDANAALLLSALVGNQWLSLVLRSFAFFAIVTSFLGVSLSLRDFLADGFKIKETGFGRMKLFLLTFVPTFLFMWLNPHAFLSALEYAGAFGVMILLGFLPALVVWKGRGRQDFAKLYTAPGGKGALLLVMVIAAAIVLLEIANKCGFAAYYIHL